MDSWLPNVPYMEKCNMPLVLVIAKLAVPTYKIELN